MNATTSRARRRGSGPPPRSSNLNAHPATPASELARRYTDAEREAAAQAKAETPAAPTLRAVPTPAPEPEPTPAVTEVESAAVEAPVPTVAEPAPREDVSLTTTPSVPEPQVLAPVSSEPATESSDAAAPPAASTARKGKQQKHTFEMTLEERERFFEVFEDRRRLYRQHYQYERNLTQGSFSAGAIRFAFARAGEWSSRIRDSAWGTSDSRHSVRKVGFSWPVELGFTIDDMTVDLKRELRSAGVRVTKQQVVLAALRFALEHVSEWYLDCENDGRMES